MPYDHSFQANLVRKTAEDSLKGVQGELCTKNGMVIKMCPLVQVNLALQVASFPYFGLWTIGAIPFTNLINSCFGSGYPIKYPCTSSQAKDFKNAN